MKLTYHVSESPELCPPAALPGLLGGHSLSRSVGTPLWALRTRNRLMHDGLSLTREEAILCHGGQTAGVTAQYQKLSAGDRAALPAFLDSL